MKLLRTCVIWLACLLLSSLPVAAADAAATDTFTHWTLSGRQKAAVVTRSLYHATETVDARRLGMAEGFGNIVDMDNDEKNNTYILTDESRIVCLDPAMQLLEYRQIVDGDGQAVTFEGSKGFYVHSSTEMYIADTENGRVLYCVDGVVRQEITLPESALIPEDFEFEPTKIAKDRQGFLYVISEGSYYGALMYDPQGQFSCFYGANSVEGDILTTLGYLWDRLTMTDEQMAVSRKTLPFQFVDICIDKEGFAYTCTNSASGQLCRLSPGGISILSSSSFNFGEQDIVERFGERVDQSFIDVEATGDGFIYAMDQSFGLVYIYDTDGTMIAAFGGGRGLGKQTGVFSSACAMTLMGDRLLVADSLRNNVTVFRLTDYGQLLMQAQRLTMDSEYTQARTLWEQVLEYDAFNHLALSGLSKAAYMEGDYALAADYAKRGGDVTTYDQAQQQIQSAFLQKNFVWLFPLAVLLLAAIVVVTVYSLKHQVVIIRNRKVQLLVQGMIHPFNSFREIKEKKQGSLWIALIMTALFFFSSAAASIWSDFRYTSYNSETYSSLFQLVQTAGLILLWSVANWGVSTLMEGKGRLKDVFVVTAYSTLPMVLYSIVSIPLTYLLTSTGSAFLSGLNTVALIVTGIMLTIGLMIAHDFDFPRFVFSAFVTVLMMILVIFVLFMFAILLTQFGSFIVNAILEAIRY